ncbi:efflux transporter outer membrane subunit [Variovorax sp. Sphag1AA]|uniref:efflux transporter outer membrane subunit n=1 Tax=Variovorax sp. Sphag1AA TaxID=2587027 RepID=UPI00185EE818|nr:efflux transporter outer membrane subunit [Variovorax sp. Sphag1AA]MBB3178049.1 NodT family efflux transporter outer membrane factor (OMF) lipoprotein [Variovorax sp. Sphag1AA]
MRSTSIRSLTRVRRVASLASAALLAACTVGPDYVRPDLSLPARYVAGAPSPEAGSQRLVDSDDIPAQWWQAFHSDALSAWVRDSLAHNPNIDSAQAALRVAQENAQAEAGALWPAVALNYSPIRQKVSEAVASPVSTNELLYTLHTAQVTVTYAPDVFGGTRRTIEAARAQVETQQFQLEAANLTLSSNVVVAAINEASLRGQRDATIAIVESQKQSLQMFDRAQRLGQASLADVDAQKAALAASEAALPLLDKQLAIQRNQLLILAGRYPADDTGERFDLAAIELPAELPVTLPSTLVEHRPDVRAAEAQMHAASAAVGVAVAARLPSVVLGVNNYGSAAATLSGLFSSSTMFWTLAASVTQPVLDGGMLKHREAAARAAFDQSTAQYRATVLGAFQDVANALQSVDADTRALRTALDAEHAASRSLARSREQFRLGDASALSVLQAQQAWQQATVNLVQARAARLTDTAALFVALGGGWWSHQGEAVGMAAPDASRNSSRHTE